MRSQLLEALGPQPFLAVLIAKSIKALVLIVFTVRLKREIEHTFDEDS